MLSVFAAEYATIKTIVSATSNMAMFVLNFLLSNLVIHLVNSCPEVSWDTILIPFLSQMCFITFTVGYNFMSHSSQLLMLIHCLH